MIALLKVAAEYVESVQKEHKVRPLWINVDREKISIWWEQIDFDRAFPLANGDKYSTAMVDNYRSQFGA